ncbi:hypothetical protein ZIOFF_070723 [Zingiber officinale]|uniref:Uncharacterized protein n=1 Tax=Zingiber officinale TaxID=94328 RepID=A0A8J5C8Y5_ZINOF|nr:hypothetical protein ZIOFF_070723 [Zingiber officinale]
MPSGPRKRRAARRKKGMENSATLLPSDPSKDGEQHEDLMLHESRESERESPLYSSAPSSPFVESRPTRSLNHWFGSEAVDCAAESSQNDLKAADLVQQDEQDVAFAVTEVALLPTDASDAKSELFAQSEKEYRKSFEESTISIEKIVSLSEERSQGKSDEFVESDKEDKKPSEKSAISVKDITALPEESSQISEVAANVLEKVSGDQRLKGAQPHDANGIVKQDGGTSEPCQVARGEKTLPAAETPFVFHDDYPNKASQNIIVVIVLRLSILTMKVQE